MIAALLLVATTAGMAPPTPAGFICRSPDGQSKRLNVDLRRRRYNDGTGSRKIAPTLDTTILLDNGNPDLIETPMGPIRNRLKLNRIDLTLIEQTSIPLQGVNKVVEYKCVQIGVIDFSVEHRF